MSMKIIRRLLPLLLAWLLWLPLPAADMQIRPYVTATHFASDDEMLQGNITWMLQDGRGMVWIGSFNGLNKYDGYEWEKFKSYPGRNSILRSNRINRFWENSLGDFYCDADSRLYHFDVDKRLFSDIQQVIEDKYHLSPHITRGYALSNHHSYLIGDRGECFRINDERPEDDIQLLDFHASRSDLIFNVFQDSHGREWILSSEGTWCNGLSEVFSKRPLRFWMEKDDEVWLTSADGKTLAIWSYAVGKTVYYDFINENGYVYEQHVVGDSLLYVASGDGLWQVTVKTGQPDVQPTMSRLTGLVFQHFYVTQRGVVWGLTPDMDIFRVDPQTDRAPEIKQIDRPADHSFSDSRVQFHEDANGYCWMFCFDNSDVLYYNESSGRLERPLLSHDISSQKTYGFFIDRQGEVWYRGRHHVDLLQIHDEPFKLLDGPSDNEVRSLLVDSRERLWIGIRDKGVLCLDRNYVPIDSFMIDGTAYCFMEDSHANLWIGSKEGGVYVVPGGDLGNKSQIRNYRHKENDPNSLSSDNVYQIVEDSYGQIWVATFGGGICLFKDGVFHHQSNRLGYSSQLPETVRCLHEVRPGVFMVGARNGLFLFDNRFDTPENIHMLHYTKQAHDLNSLPDNDIMNIMVTEDSMIVLTTNSGGICRVITPLDRLLSEPLRFESFTKNDGLASDVAYAALEDTQNYIWVVSGQALSRLQRGFTEADPTRKSSSVSIFDVTSFPEKMSFSEALPVMSGNRLILGTMNGLFIVETDKMPSNVYLPPLIVENLSLNDAESDDNRSATIRFTALDYRDKRHLKYAYRLDNVDRQWNITSNTAVTYVNLPVGRHTFHVRSTNADGLWIDNEQTLTLYVKPRFFETWVGRALLLVAAIILLYTVFYYIGRVYRLRHALTEEQESTNTKLRFFTDISHELRTPLTLIDGPVSEVLEDQTLSDQSRYYLEVVQKNVRRLLNLVNQILDFRKLQNHKMTLLVEEISLRPFLEGIMENFRELARDHQIDFTLDCAGDLPPLWADRDKLEKICFNLLSNAFKYTDNGKAITLKAGTASHGGKEEIVITVSDQGKGIRKEDIDKLFQRFETIMQNNLFKPSSGIGLALVKQLVELHHARIEVESEPGRGSDFILVFKAGKHHFEQDQNVQLRIADSPLPQETLPEMALDEAQAEETDSVKVLVVEDNDELRDFISKILSADYQVLTAADGQEGMTIGKQQWPDLIITDIMMPRMDGFEMIRHLKEDPDLYAVPIIALTAKGAMDDKIHGIEMGVDDYVLKPFSSAYLKARVAALIEQRKRLQRHFMDLLSQGGNALTRRSLEPEMPDITPADELFIQDVMAFIEKNIDNAELTIDEFADAMKMGRTVFYNKIKSTLGLTPIDFVQEMRIKRAVQLMKSSDFTIAEIAYQTGFNDPKYFSRSFKKHMKATPSEYIKKLQADKK